MEKLIYLLDRATTAGTLQHFLLGDALTNLREAGAVNFTINIANLDKDVSVVAPQRIAGPWDTIGAVVSVWTDTVDRHPAYLNTLAAIGCEVHGYLVTESVPQPCDTTWPEGERRPGVTQFTAHGKPANVADADFYRNWAAHTELSFQLHPDRWSYVRNAVTRPLTEHAPPYRALVLEHFRSLQDFTDEDRYFGDPAIVQQMYEELPGFCDFNTMATGPMSEYRFT